MIPKKLIQWWSTASPTKRAALAEHVGTTTETLRTGMSRERGFSVERAAAIEAGVRKLDRKAGITRCDIHATCARCPHARGSR